MTNRPPIPPEHRSILARLTELMLEWARAEAAKEKSEPALAARSLRRPDGPEMIYGDQSHGDE